MALFSRRFNRVWLVVAALSWLLLLGSTALRASPALAARWDVLPSATAQLVAQAALALSAFLYERGRRSRLHGMEFVSLLRRLMTGSGLVACLGAAGHLLGRLTNLSVTTPAGLSLSMLYVINIGLTTYFLAESYNTWRALVFFRSTPGTRKQWLWFELLLGASLTLRLALPGETSPWLALPLLALGGMGVYLGSHQQWVAYLSRRQRLGALLMQTLALAGSLLLLGYYLNIHRDTALAIPAAQQSFVLTLVGFASFFSAMGLLVTFVTLPTAGIFEQKREEILSMQRLAQMIQRGQSEQEVYHLLFDSAVQTVDADAAWLDLLDDGNPPPPLVYRIDQPTRASICKLLGEYNIGHIEYLNNDLQNSAGFRSLELPYGSLTVMPLRSAKHQYGTLYLLKDNAQGFDRESMGLLQTFTSQTVLSIENLRLMEESLQNERVKEELKIASIVQESLIPKVLPVDSWFEIRWHSQAAREVGGDFYDFLQLSSSRIAIIIGDVSGKGTTAAFHGAQLKGIFHALMLLDQPEQGRPLLPSKFMTMANQALSHCLERSSFITASIYIIDYKERGFAFARAGHCHTLYYNAVTEDTFYFQTEGLGLGIIRDASYEKRIKNMYYDYNPGDVMVIYTDGIVEARNAAGDEYGEPRLRQLLANTFYLEAEEIKQAIVADLAEFSHGQPPFDDQTLLVIKFRSSQPSALA